MLGYLSADIICSEKRTVFRERSSRKTVSYEERIMSKDKYPSIFSPQMEAIVFIIFQILFATRSCENWGIFSDIPQFQLGNIRSDDALRPIARERKDFAPVVRKPISANPRLNRANPQNKFVLRLNSVPRSSISTIQGLN